MNFEGLTIQPVTSSNILYVFFIMLVVCFLSVKILAVQETEDDGEATATALNTCV